MYFACLALAFALSGVAADRPASRTVRQIEGWTVRVDDRLLAPPNAELGRKVLRTLEAKLADITVVVPPGALKALRAVTIVVDLNHGKLAAMQYHPSAGWLTAHGYAADLARCVHVPHAADLLTSRSTREMPWVVLHELAHAYHDQVLGFADPRVAAAYEAYKKSGRGEKVLRHDGKRARHYALTNRMEFFAEMTEAFFGSNDFYPFNRAELREAEPDTDSLLEHLWGTKSPRPGSAAPKPAPNPERRL